MRLMHFADVHPDWSAIESFGAAETRSTLELLMTTMMIDGQVTEPERQILLDTIARLPLGGTDIDNDEIQQIFNASQERLQRFAEKPDEFGPYLDRACAAIEGREERIAVMRLVAMTCVTDGFAENELDMARAIGHRFELPQDTVENILKATWESLQAHKAETDPNIERDPKPVRSARHHEEHDMEPHNMPFSYDERSA